MATEPKKFLPQNAKAARILKKNWRKRNRKATML
jgi:hypothetical protein